MSNYYYQVLLYVWDKKHLSCSVIQTMKTNKTTKIKKITEELDHTPTNNHIRHFAVGLDNFFLSLSPSQSGLDRLLWKH